MFRSMKIAATIVGVILWLAVCALFLGFLCFLIMGEL